MKLSILIGMDSLSFIAVDANGNVKRHGSCSCSLLKSEGSTSAEDELLQVMKSSDLHHADQVASINLDTPHFCIVPESLFNPEELSSYYLSKDIDRDDLVWSQTQSHVFVYQFPLHVRGILSRLFPAAIVKHLSESLYLHLSKQDTQQPTIYLLQRSSRLYVLAFQNGQLRKMTHYTVADWRDVLYFCTLAREVVDWKADPKVCLNGDRELVQAIHPHLEGRVADLEVIEWKNGWRLPDSLSDPMQLFDLYCVHHADHSRRI